MNRFLLTAFTAAALLFPASTALAAPGDLDTTFSGDGVDLLDFGQQDLGHGVAIQPDGKIVVLATAVDGAGKGDFAVARLNADGSPDETFSGDGRVQFGFSGVRQDANDRTRALALAPDGAIVVTGMTDANSATGIDDIAVARVTSAGELDATFNGSGKQTIDYGQSDAADDVAVLDDGSVVVGGTAVIGSDQDFAVARLTPSGQPDKSWSGDGRASAHFGAAEQLSGLALTSDGGVVAAGQFQNVSTSTDTAIARFRSDGEFETTGFASGGKLVLSLGGKDHATDIAVQPDGKIVLSVTDASPTVKPSLVARLTPTGARDATFGDDGVARVPLNDSSLPIALALAPSGRIVVTGRVSSQPNPTNFMVAELETDGQPDGAFGGEGFVTHDFGADETPFALAAAEDRALVVGVSVKEGNVPIAAYKLDEPSAGADPAPAPPSTPDTPQAPPQAAPPAPDTIAPVVSKLKLKARRGTEKGAFRLSERASVKVTVQRKVKRGRRTRLVAARTLKLPGKPGANSFKLKRLKPGSYRVTLKATDVSGNRSKAVRARCSLKKRR